MGSPGSFGFALILVLLAGLRSMRAANAARPHLPDLWAGPGSYLLLRQAKEKMPLGQVA